MSQIEILAQYLIMHHSKSGSPSSVAPGNGHVKANHLIGICAGVLGSVALHTQTKLQGNPRHCSQRGKNCFLLELPKNLGRNRKMMASGARKEPRKTRRTANAYVMYTALSLIPLCEVAENLSGLG
jgi:hypothetical protein